MRWVCNQRVSNQSGESEADGLLALNWEALGLLIQQQAFDAVVCHQRLDAEHRATVSIHGPQTEALVESPVISDIYQA